MEQSSSTPSPRSSPKKHTRTTKSARRSTNNIETKVDKTSTNSREHERLNALLQNLNIRFTNCTFTYKTAHLQTKCSKPKKSKSTLKRFKNTLSNTLERISSAVVGENCEFKNCIFVPKNEEDDIHEFVRKNFSDSDTKIRFENCKFMKRGSSFFEKVAKKLRGVFGIIFELTYPNSQVVVEEYVFRLKDIPIVSTYVQERIVEKG